MQGRSKSRSKKIVKCYNCSINDTSKAIVGLKRVEKSSLRFG